MKRLLVGCEDFEELRRKDCYYVDKTNFIKELIDSHGKVTLFTRPRRFGKTLTMSMLKHFFDIGSDPSLFEGLDISREQELCSQYQGKYPVIFISMKSAESSNFQKALDRLSISLSDLYQTYAYLLDSEKESLIDKKRFLKIMELEASEKELISALVLLLRMLHIYYGKKAILLIDEYDVPLDKAYHAGYYEEMIVFIRGLFSEALKTNNDLEFAVLTGCLRVSKESIFTGLNNFKINAVSNEDFAPYFGFTDTEVRQILNDYHAESVYEEVKEWYDGYHFGGEEMYCPWDIINYVDLLRNHPDTRPRLFWINTSSNSIIRELIDIADDDIRENIEALIQGESIQAPVSENLTYYELRNSPDNLWSMLYLTGYLTLAGKSSGTLMEELVIPNKEIRTVFVEQIRKWMKESLCMPNRDEAAKYLFERQPEKLQEFLNDILSETISYFDYGEDFYHAFLAGILAGSRHRVESNREHGLGRSDLVIHARRIKTAVIIEVKHAKKYQEMENLCEKGLEQIEDKNYAEPFIMRGWKVIKYGITFFEKECLVKMAES